MLRYCVWEVITLVPLALEPCPSQLTGRRAGQQIATPVVPDRSKSWTRLL